MNALTYDSHPPRPSVSGKIRREVSRTLKLGMPLVAAQLVQMSMGFVDTIMAGNFSATALAAVAVGNSIYMPILIFILGILLVINPIVAQLYGAGERARIGEHLWQVLWLSVFLAVVGFFLLRNMRFVLEFFQVQPEIILIAQGYLQAISWGVPAAFAYSALRYFNEGLHITKPQMFFALLGLGINICGNYVFMYGHLGSPAMGAVGTGWATALVMWSMLVCMVLFTFRKETQREYVVRQGFGRPAWIIQKEFLRVGFPNGISFGIEVSMFAVAALIIGSMGIDAVAAHQITINFAAFTFMVPLGLSFAIAARVGFEVGKEERENARFIGFVGIGLCGFFMSLTAILMLTVPELIIAMYTQNPQVTQIAVKLLFLAAIFQVSDGLQVGGLAALRGLKDTKVPMFVNVVAYWVMGLFTGYVLGVRFGYGPEGLWIGMILGLSVAAISHNVRFHHLTQVWSRETADIGHEQTDHSSYLGRGK